MWQLNLDETILVEKDLKLILSINQFYKPRLASKYVLAL